MQGILRGLASVLDRLDEAQRDGTTDPIKLIDAMMGNNYVRRDEATGAWWELFELDAKPGTKQDLTTAWHRWSAKHHPDKGGSEPAFRFMRGLYEAQVAKLPEKA